MTFGFVPLPDQIGRSIAIFCIVFTRKNLTNIGALALLMILTGAPFFASGQPTNAYCGKWLIGNPSHDIYGYSYLKTTNNKGFKELLPGGSGIAIIPIPEELIAKVGSIFSDPYKSPDKKNYDAKTLLETSLLSIKSKFHQEMVSALGEFSKDEERILSNPNLTGSRVSSTFGAKIERHLSNGFHIDSGWLTRLISLPSPAGDGSFKHTTSMRIVIPKDHPYYYPNASEGMIEQYGQVQIVPPGFIVILNSATRYYHYLKLKLPRDQRHFFQALWHDSPDYKEEVYRFALFNFLEINQSMIKHFTGLDFWSSVEYKPLSTKDPSIESLGLKKLGEALSGFDNKIESYFSSDVHPQ